MSVREFSDINEMIRSLNIDMSLWENQEIKKFTKKKVYESIEPVLTHVPHHLLERTITCMSGHTFTPNWIEKTPPPVAFRYKNGILRNSSYNIICPICQGKASVEFPDIRQEGEIDIYGDEAKRNINKKTLLVYSFTAFPGEKSKEVEFTVKFLKIKTKMSPMFRPNEWTLHMKDLVGTEKRAHSKYLKHLSFQDVISYTREILQLIREFVVSDKLIIYSGIGFYEGENLPKKPLEKAQDNVYSSAIARIIYETTRKGISPKFYFERTGSDGWSKKLFEGGRLSLLWGFLSHNLPVKSPEFVAPNKSIFLEVADIVSYVIARYIFCVEKSINGVNIKPDWSPQELGFVRYMVTMMNGDWQHYYSDQVPLKGIFQGIEVEHDLEKYHFAYFTKRK